MNERSHSELLATVAFTSNDEKAETRRVCLEANVWGGKREQWRGAEWLRMRAEEKK